MSDKVESIRQRLKLADSLPETFGNGNSAADRWREDVTTLLAEIERLKQISATTVRDSVGYD